MCGIVYSKSLIGKPVNSTIFRRYKAQRGRGTDGFGFYLPQTNKLTHNTREGRILRLLKRNKADEIMFHHRFPTSTLNVRNGCHPFSTKDFFENNYVLIHNGVIWNDDDLKKKHEQLGIKYVSEMDDGSFNDSEALLYEVAMYLEGWQTKVEAQGSIAFVVAKRSAEGEPLGIYFGRNYSNPLKLKLTDLSITLSSEGEGNDVEPHKMHYFDYETGKLTSSNCTFQTGLSNYDGYYGYSRYEDDELYGIGGARTEYEIERALKKYDFNDLEHTRISRVKDKLLYDNFENPYDAVMSAEESIQRLKEREALLENIIRSDIASEAETDEYMALPDQIYYLQQAMSELEKEAAAQKEQTFFHIPAETEEAREVRRA